MEVFHATLNVATDWASCPDELLAAAMTPYRYFEEKGRLLRGIWQYVLHESAQATRHAAAGFTDANERIRVQVGAFIDYWEAHPEHYRLVYMTDQTTRREDQGALMSPPTYSYVLETSLEASRQLAEQIGGDLANAKLATDVRFMMVSGYLHARMVNRRYPWSPVDVLRPAFIELMLEAAASCLRNGPQRAPAPARKRSRPKAAQKS